MRMSLSKRHTATVKGVWHSVGVLGVKSGGWVEVE